MIFGPPDILKRIYIYSQLVSWDLKISNNPIINRDYKIPEILDDSEHPDGKRAVTSAGSLYDLISPTEKSLKTVGEFNEARIKVKNNQVEHWQNGKKILAYEYGSNTINELIAKSKFKSMPLFAKANSGHVGLQHHGEEVWYRNIRIRKL